MVKFLPIVIILLLAAFAGANKAGVFQRTQADQTYTFDEDRVYSLEKRVNTLEKSATESLSRQSPAIANAPGRGEQDQLGSIELALSDIKGRLSKLENTTPNKKAPLYIPFGISGSVSSIDWSYPDTQEVLINPADYIGYKNMQLEIQLRVQHGNGMATARLLNATDGTAIILSEVSTITENYTTLISQGFMLPSGSKTYRLQLKTTTGYTASYQNAKIKVNY